MTTVRGTRRAQSRKTPSRFTRRSALAEATGFIGGSSTQTLLYTRIVANRLSYFWGNLRDVIETGSESVLPPLALPPSLSVVR